MIGLRVALLAALLAAGAAAQAQQGDASDMAPPLRAAVTAYRSGDLPTAEALLRKLVPENGDAEAWLGAVLIDRGDARGGLDALQRAASRGSAEAEQQLGMVFAQGLAGTPRDDKRAAELFGKAAAAGNRRAQLNLGVLYFRGQGVPRDLVQSRAWLEKAAAGDDPLALYALGRAVEESEGAAVADPVRAADLYRRAAEKGHPLATLRYGLALEAGNGVPRDPVSAQKWLVAAQQSGVPEAALALGDLAARSATSRDKAANLKAVQSAVSWFEVAARAGVASAQFKLANAYLAGAGVTRDPAQAQAWYLRAAQQGLPEAEFALGIMMTGGIPGPPDAVEGYKWLLLAERAGHLDPHGVRETAGEKISQADRKTAEGRAQAFVATPERPTDDMPPRPGRPPQ